MEHTNPPAEDIPHHTLNDDEILDLGNKMLKEAFCSPAAATPLGDELISEAFEMITDRREIETTD